MLGSNLIAASLAVGAAIYAMSLLRCIHPPGGATSLSAVMGGDSVYSLGFLYVLFPVAYSCLVMFSLAFILNFPFRWRRYPAHLFHLMNPVEKISARNRHSEVTLEDFLYAVKKHDSYLDITEETWIEIFEIAKQSAEFQVKHPDTIGIDKYYSNGKLGLDWEIRKVLSIDPDSEKTIRFIVVAGKAPNVLGASGEIAFKAWAKYEVKKVKNSWVKTESS